MIISISGKLGSGKDTVGEIVQIITNSPHFTDEAVLSFIGREKLNPKWEVKRFADKLKDIVCMLLGCTREQLEDREFKEKELGEEWVNSKDDVYYGKFLSERYSPRSLLQLIGTNLFREQILNNIWVNALMSEYKPLVSYQGVLLGLGMSDVQMEKIGKSVEAEYPNWIITDMRFPNELKAVEDKKGITIRVNRISSCECGNSTDWIYSTIKDGSNRYCRKCNQKQTIKNEHASETALDNAEFDYTIDNDGTLLELVGKVRELLIKEKIR